MFIKGLNRDGARAVLARLCAKHGLVLQATAGYARPAKIYAVDPSDDGLWQNIGAVFCAEMVPESGLYPDQGTKGVRIYRAPRPRPWSRKQHV